MLDTLRRRIAGCLLPAAAVAACALLFAAQATAADLFYDATLSLPIGDDARFFLNLTNRHYAPPQPVAVDVVGRCAHPADDFPVIMLLAEASGWRPADILRLRLEGRTWSAIFVRTRVSHDILFAGLDRDPGPPYGKAWGHWKNHHGPKKKLAFDDDQIVALAKLQTVSAYYRVSPYRVTTEMSQGVSVERYAVAHGRPPGPVSAKKHKGQKNGQAHGHGEKNPGHGNQNDQR
jgi:hypothetical protein